MSPKLCLLQGIRLPKSEQAGVTCETVGEGHKRMEDTLVHQFSPHPYYQAAAALPQWLSLMEGAPRRTQPYELSQRAELETRVDRYPRLSCPGLGCSKRNGAGATAQFWEILTKSLHSASVVTKLLWNKLATHDEHIGWLASMMQRLHSITDLIFVDTKNGRLCSSQSNSWYISKWPKAVITQIIHTNLSFLVIKTSQWL